MNEQSATASHPHSSEEISDLARENGVELSELGKRLSELRAKRQSILLAGDDDHLLELDDQVQETERLISLREDRASELSRLRREAIESERVEEIPQILEETGRVLARTLEAEEAFEAAKSRLGAVVNRLSSSWGWVEIKRPHLLRALPEISDELRAEGHRILGPAFKIPGPAPAEEDPDRPVAHFDAGTGKWTLSGNWTQEDRAAWFRYNRPAAGSIEDRSVGQRVKEFLQGS